MVSLRTASNVRWLVAAGLAALAATYVALASERDDKKESDARSYTIGLFGDMPYNALGRSQYPALLANINAAHVEFSVYDGDLKAGADGPCDEPLYDTAIKNFNTLERPLIWVPGDNDWTDCWGRYGPPTLPYFDPIDRLNLERALFAATDRSLGQKTLKLDRQSDEGGLYALYSENVRWKKGDVVYLG